MSQLIKVEYSDDGMWGSEGWDGYDVGDSYDRFEKLVNYHIHQVFPDAEVDFSYGINDKCSVDGDTSNQDAEKVQHIVGEIWQDFNWVVKADPRARM